MSGWIYGILNLMRPNNGIMMGLAVITGIFIASRGDCPWLNCILGFSVGFLLTAGTMCINDYFDREIDALNAPSRPIPSGLVTASCALETGILLAVLGLIVSTLINLRAFLIALFSVGLMLYYNLAGKRTGFLGNLIVSLCVSLPFVFGGVVVGSLSGALIVFSLMAFLANTGREVTKGIADIEGDKIKDVRTLAVTCGSKKAARIAAAFYLAAVAVSPVPLISGWLSPLYGITVSAADLGFLYSSTRLFFGISPREALSIKSWVLLWMALGLASFLIGAL